VLRFSVPAGLTAGAASFVCYLLARSDHATGQVADTSSTTLTLFLVSLWALAIIARPYSWWRVVLVLAMGGGFAIVLTVPWLQHFFELQLVGHRDPWTAAALGVAAGVLLELAWRFMRPDGEGADRAEPRS
jgi:cation-transporting ATPase E